VQSYLNNLSPFWKWTWNIYLIECGHALLAVRFGACQITVVSFSYAIYLMMIWYTIMDLSEAFVA
jgi:hypothetical protein